MRLIKHIDFTKETSLDSSIWNVEIGEKWSNRELQQYTDDSENLYFDNGLVICATYNQGVYKSARINTKGKLCFLYGRIEIKAKVPSGKGTWPALWMMSNTTPYGHWPKSGEIDIMEHVGNQKDWLYSCLHTEKYNHKVDDYYYAKNYYSNLTDTFHTYTLVWTKEHIEYYFDKQKVVTYTRGITKRDSSPAGWPFDHPFYLIMNLAVGGTLGGKVIKEDFPQRFVIQSIKIWQ